MLHRSRSWRALALLLMLVNPGFSESVSAMVRSCAPAPTAMAMPGMAHQVAPPSTTADRASVQAPSDHHCSHCPPADCTTTPGCAGGNVVALAVGALPWTGDTSPAASIGLPPMYYASAVPSGLTPPPQRIL